MRLLLSTFIIAASTTALSAEKNKNEKGLLPELRIKSGDEAANQKKALQSEVLITKTENQAIQSLINIIKKQKGKPTEPDLWNRLAELYMRRAKSGRFFDLYRTSDEAAKFAPPEVRDESSAQNLRRAIQVYYKIEKDFPNFREMDVVLFNNAFANHQLGTKNVANEIYQKMVNKFPRSSLVPDAYLALGELHYDEQKFAVALEYFSNIEKFPNARVFSYGMYKAAWSLYNLHKSEEAINKLVEVVKLHDPKTGRGKVNHNLRQESLRDLALFFEETNTPDKAYGFFQPLTSIEELGEVFITMGKIYESHSRYKDMNVFLPVFIERHPTAFHTLKAHVLLIQANEALRNRKMVIEQLRVAASLCDSKSPWFAANAQAGKETCDYDLASQNTEIAKKWWELWLKNKQNAELAQETREAFRILVAREDTSKPDLKSRYAYAELLFQLNDFRESSKQYEFVGTRSEDTQIKHEANYSALVALEKASQKGKLPEDDDQLLRLCNQYLERHPKGGYADQVKFKVGFLAYEQNKFDVAEKTLKPLAIGNGAPDLKKKSEDIILDILNSRKDFAGIKSFAASVMSGAKDNTRKTELSNILQEASFAEVQELAKKDKIKAARELVKFTRDNPNSKLAKDSLWQALSIYNAEGRLIDGADTAVDYFSRYPQDKKSIPALKDAAKNYAESGLIVDSARTLELLARASPSEAERSYDTAAELYLVGGKPDDSRRVLKIMAEGKSQSQQGILYGRILQSLNGQENSAEYKQAESKVVALGIEPYASNAKLKVVEDLIEKRKPAEAFNAAKNLINNEKADSDARAKARLIQATILEDEFMRQSTRSSIDKLSIVLGLKTEKLDKVQQAYLSALKLAKNPNIKLKCLEGLQRVYINYVDTVGNPNVKADLKEDEKKALREELGKLTAPIAEKNADISKQLKSLAKESNVTESSVTDFANLPAKDTVKPKLKTLSLEGIPPYLVLLLQDGGFLKFEPKQPRCVTKDLTPENDMATLVEVMSQCAAAKNPAEIEKVATLAARKNSNSFLPTYFMSVAAQLQGRPEKSIWMAEISIKKAPDSAFAHYQKGRAAMQLADFATANSAFMRSGDLGMKVPEVNVIKGSIFYNQGDCYQAIEEFNKLEPALVRKFGLVPVVSECQAQSGDFDKAIFFCVENLKTYQPQVDLFLQMGHIHETYRFDTAKAIDAYTNAAKISTRADQKEWIERKLQFLKNPSRVGIDSSANDTKARGGT